MAVPDDAILYSLHFYKIGDMIMDRSDGGNIYRKLKYDKLTVHFTHMTQNRNYTEMFFDPVRIYLGRYG